MSRKHMKKSRYLSWLIRHRVCNQSVLLDEAGWTNLDEVLRVSGASRDISKKSCATIRNTGLRSRTDALVPASETVLKAVSRRTGWRRPGSHTLRMEQSGMAQASLPWNRSRARGIYGANPCPLRSRTRQRRRKRADVQVLLQIDPGKLGEAGLSLFVAPNGAVLARRIPREAISD
jgi:hypothetical protein